VSVRDVSELTKMFSKWASVIWLHSKLLNQLHKLIDKRLELLN
jgi:hypothetical protein